jgi:hypothetical protein
MLPAFASLSVQREVSKCAAAWSKAAAEMNATSDDFA